MFDRVRRALRDKLLRVVTEGVTEQRDQLIELRREVAELRHQLSGETNRMIQSVRDTEHRARHDLSFAGELEAAQATARFVGRHMVSARQFDSPHATLNPDPPMRFE